MTGSLRIPTKIKGSYSKVFLKITIMVTRYNSIKALFLDLKECAQNLICQDLVKSEYYLFSDLITDMSVLAEAIHDCVLNSWSAHFILAFRSMGTEMGESKSTVVDRLRVLGAPIEAFDINIDCTMGVLNIEVLNCYRELLALCGTKVDPRTGIVLGVAL